MNSIELMRCAGLECSIDKEICRIVRYAHLSDEHSVFVDVTMEEKYVRQALEKGAVVLSQMKYEGVIQVENARKTMTELLQILYEFPCQKLKLIGVTGTCGKSTVVHLLRDCLKDQGIESCCVMSGKVLLNDEVIETRNTTPDASFLIPLMDQCVKRGISVMMMEVSSEAYLAYRVEGFTFDVMIGTLIASDHLDSHRTLLDYQNTKKEILSLTKSDGVVILNADDPLLKKWMNELNGHVLTYGCQPSSFQISNVQLSINGSSFLFQHIPISSKLLSMANVYNLSAVMVCAFVLDLNMKRVFAWAQRAKGCAGRFEVIHHNPLILIDYAHTEAAVHEVLSFIKSCTSQRMICVFGCGGDRDPFKRPLMAKAVCQYADQIVVTMDNPRSENPEKIMSEVLAGCSGQVYAEMDRMKAIQFALESCSKDDIIVLLGKGDETSLFSCGQILPYSDKEAVFMLLREE